jgi:ribosomal protein L31E
VVRTNVHQTLNNEKQKNKVNQFVLHHGIQNPNQKTRCTVCPQLLDSMSMEP